LRAKYQGRRDENRAALFVPARTETLRINPV
jgi:hypothetical protein